MGRDGGRNIKSLLIVGAGSYGKVVKELAVLSEYDKIDFWDEHGDDKLIALGTLDELQDQYDGVIIAIGRGEVRERLLRTIRRPATLIHPDARVSPSAMIGRACVIEAGSIVNSNAHIGDACLICAGAVVNHDADVRSFCQIDCNAVVESGAIVPPKTKVESCTVYRR